MNARLDEIEARAAKGAAEVIRLCSIDEHARMSIPANMERDTDLILMDVCDSVPVLVAALRVAWDCLDRLDPGHEVYFATETEPAECTDECPGCDIDATVAAITAALDAS